MNTKRILTPVIPILAALILLAPAADVYAQAETSTPVFQTDSIQNKSLSQEDINLVMKVFDGREPSFIISRADAFIQTGKTDEETARIAWYIYNYYRQSNIMGYDEIAFYIADTYFV